jgi:phosphotransferase system  glucose/maltose/N-acetylglucosamine-specific IIC component
MTKDKPLKKIVRYYVYLMCFLTAVVLVVFSNEPLLMSILLWLFFCLVVYRSIYDRYFMKESEKKSLQKIWPSLYESQEITFTHVFLTLFAFLMVWGITYGTLNAYTPALKPYIGIIALINGLIYGFFYFAQVLDE